MNFEIPNNDNDYDLSLLHPDWDHELVVYLNVVEPIKPKISSTGESSNTSCSQESAKLSSHKIEIKQGKRPSAENHFMATLDQSGGKIKGVSDGENLLEAPENGKFDTLPAYFLERSTILIEPTKAVNIGTSKDPKVLHPIASLSDEENKDYIEFFKQRQINFSWSYAHMP